MKQRSAAEARGFMARILLGHGALPDELFDNMTDIK
jgi:hypothetical protein